MTAPDSPTAPVHPSSPCAQRVRRALRAFGASLESAWEAALREERAAGREHEREHVLGLVAQMVGRNTAHAASLRAKGQADDARLWDERIEALAELEATLRHGLTAGAA